MFKEGDIVVFGNNGVCRVDAVGPTDLFGSGQERLYYTLIPVYGSESKIFTPVDNQKVVCRAVISKEEAEKLIADIQDIEALWVPDERRREESYKAAVSKCDCLELIKIIKTLYLRKQARIAEGKKVTSSDERYLKLSEDRLYGEFAVALGIPKDEVKDYIFKCVEELGSNIER